MPRFRARKKCHCRISTHLFARLELQEAAGLRPVSSSKPFSHPTEPQDHRLLRGEPDWQTCHVYGCQWLRKPLHLRQRLLRGGRRGRLRRPPECLSDGGLGRHRHDGDHLRLAQGLDSLQIQFKAKPSTAAAPFNAAHSSEAAS